MATTWIPIAEIGKCADTKRPKLDWVSNESCKCSFYSDKSFLLSIISIILSVCCMSAVSFHCCNGNSVRFSCTKVRANPSPKSTPKNSPAPERNPKIYPRVPKEDSTENAKQDEKNGWNKKDKTCPPRFQHEIN